MNELTTIATLPVTYENAKYALTECTKIDECKEWADKSAALASYAKQANDGDLLKLSQRIKARAVTRMGELFNQIESQSIAGLRQGSAPPSENINGREQAARDAGVSQDQRKQSQTIANMDSLERESLIDSDEPPTITALADMARRGKSNPRAMKATTTLLGTLKTFGAFCEDHNDVDSLLDVLADHEKAAVMENTHIVVNWLTRLAQGMGK